MSKDELSAALSNRKPAPPLQRGKGVVLSVDQAGTQERTSPLVQERAPAQEQLPESALQQISEKQEMPVSKTIEVLSEKTAVSQNGSSADVQEQEKEITQERKSAKTKKTSTAKAQEKKKAEVREEISAEEQEGEPTYEQLRELAKMVQRFNARMQKSTEEKQQKQDPADLLIQALAETQFEDFRKVAEKQKRKINQGVTIPEALFTIYKTCAMQYGLRDKKTPMGDLIAKAMIKYLVEDILPELAEEE
jgi:hypothetical protein